MNPDLDEIDKWTTKAKELRDLIHYADLVIERLTGPDNRFRVVCSTNLKWLHSLHKYLILAPEDIDILVVHWTYKRKKLIEELENLETF